MSVHIKRDFMPADRYLYDFRLCTIEKGWAQIDTGQDASYFGQWLNPVKREIFCYCEGDLILTTCDTDADLCDELARMKAWNVEMGHRFIGIDPGSVDGSLCAAVKAAGLTEYLHAIYQAAA